MSYQFMFLLRRCHISIKVDIKFDTGIKKKTFETDLEFYSIHIVYVHST